MTRSLSRKHRLSTTSGSRDRRHSSRASNNPYDRVVTLLRAGPAPALSALHAYGPRRGAIPAALDISGNSRSRRRAEARPSPLSLARFLTSADSKGEP